VDGQPVTNPVEERDGLPLVIAPFPGDREEVGAEAVMRLNGQAARLAKIYSELLAALVRVCVRKPSAPRVDWIEWDQIEAPGDYEPVLMFRHRYLMDYEVNTIMEVAAKHRCQVRMAGSGLGIETWFDPPADE
jgi:hypothetical protein